jgi:glycosyltransferase involved in cell wall biosynthesis
MRAEPPELSVVMPCLNEADTIESCIRKAQRAAQANGIAAEVIVADNGSTDESRAIALKLGARVVEVEQKGYGAALMGGIAAAHGTYIIMGDADDSYDFGEIPRFVERLREGYDLVQGCRLPWGGGRILPGAMPFLHRWIGNPLFTILARTWFGSRVSDVHCGLRGFTKGFYSQLNQRCIGMEFATEMIIKASIFNSRITEVPITLHPDGRKTHGPHLRTFRDGWRHLRFFLMFSPRWLFLLPGALLMLVGLVGAAIALPTTTINGVTFAAHTLLFACLAILVGYQAILFAVFTKIFAIAEGLMPEDRRLTRLFKVITLEKGLIAGAVALVVGVVLLGSAVNQWRLAGFGNLEYGETMRVVISGATLTALGVQTVLASFFLSILGTLRK